MPLLFANPPKTGFLASRPKCYWNIYSLYLVLFNNRTDNAGFNNGNFYIVHANVLYASFNFFLVSSDFCRLLIKSLQTVKTQIRTNSLNVSPYLDPNWLTL